MFWTVCIFLLGLLAGLCLLSLLMAVLLVRSPAKAKALNLPRVSRLIRGQCNWSLGILIVALLLARGAWHQSPEAGRQAGCILFIVACLLGILIPMVPLLWVRDEDGSRLSPARLLEHARGVMQVHDELSGVIDRTHQEYLEAEQGEGEE